MRTGMLRGVRILLGVSGGIAAYKAAELTRLLVQRGDTVRVVMTQAATRFVGPLTFHALSGHPVVHELHPEGSADAEAAMAHIELARWAEQILVAPASADFLARLRAGLADDLLSCLCLAAAVPIAVAPAMNQQMWAAAATQENLAVLRQRGISILGPASGDQACGETGPGRMLEPAALVTALGGTAQSGRLAGVRVLVSAGPTREALDPVRYLSNHSSGKMGYAIARAAASAGAAVTLVSGPVDLPDPPGIDTTRVTTAAEMAGAVLAAAPSADIYIGAAAVADYRPLAPAAEKIKKTGAALALALEPTEDILESLGRSAKRPFLVGFAAETSDHQQHGAAKLARKGLDLIAINAVGTADTGFGVDTNALTVLSATGASHVLPLANKIVLAQQLMELIADYWHATRRSQNP